MRAFALLAILTVVLAACAGGGAPQPAAPAPAPAAKPAEKAAAPAPAAPAPAAPAAAPAKPAQPAAPAKPAEKPAAQPAKPAAAQFIFRLGTATTAKHPNGVLAETFKQEVEKNSQGRISIQIFPSAALGGELEIVNGVKTAQIEMAAVAVPTVASISPAVQLSELPFFYADYDSARKVLDGEPGQMVLKTLEPQGVKGLVWGEIGFRGVLNHRKPVQTVADVRGMKIRVVENPLYVATWRALGANAVPMAWPEVYTGLQQKTIDGVDTNYAGMIDAKQYEVAKHLALTNHSYTGNLLLMNMPKFAALPADLQKVMQDAAKVGAGEARKAAKAIDDGAVDTMKGQGVAVTTVQRDEFRNAMKSVHDEFIPKIGVEIVSKAQALLR
ncbi:MAG: TRAP transporter substrate-binding protein [Chloroflexi bacterium]|nr:TRAP transporter substrate-binding protein [Chloroflexota bacterium]